MRESTDQNNSEYGCFSCSVGFFCFVLYGQWKFLELEPIVYRNKTKGVNISVNTRIHFFEIDGFIKLSIWIKWSKFPCYLFQKYCDRLLCAVSRKNKTGCRINNMPWADGTFCAEKSVKKLYNICIKLISSQFNSENSVWRYYFFSNSFRKMLWKMLM